jgi:osmotically-inducible protein OsmY
MRLPILCFALYASLTLSGCFPLAATGLATGALMIEDRRTSGIYIEDENIEWKALARLYQHYKDAHVNVTSFNLGVLITGEAPSEAMKSEIAETVRGIPSVKNVANEVAVAGNSSLTSRGNDTLITSNVKARFIGNRAFAPNHVKVVTEAGVVYLVGVVTQQEGEAAAEIARSTSGVSRVVKVFEYIAEPVKR